MYCLLHCGSVGDSFIIGVSCDKKWGAQKPESKTWTVKSGGLDPSNLIEVYAYASQYVVKKSLNKI